MVSIKAIKCADLNDVVRHLTVFTGIYDLLREFQCCLVRQALNFIVARL